MAAKKKKTIKKAKPVAAQSVIQETHKKPDKALAIIGLIINILILPGLGSIIGGRIKAGIWQLVLFIIGIPLCFVIIGIPLIIAVWIWGIVTGIQMVQASA